MNEFDCICEYNLELYRTAVGNEIKWCPACGSFKMTGTPRTHSQLLTKAKKEVGRLEKKVVELEKQFDEVSRQTP